MGRPVGDTLALAARLYRHAADALDTLEGNRRMIPAGLDIGRVASWCLYLGSAVTGQGTPGQWSALAVVDGSELVSVTAADPRTALRALVERLRRAVIS